jgi:hypothetical protein
MISQLLGVGFFILELGKVEVMYLNNDRRVANPAEQL